MATLTSGNLVATVTEAGLTNLALGGTTVLSGALRVSAAGATVLGFTEQPLGATRYAQVTVLSPTAVRVWHVYANGLAKFVYRLTSAEDLTITASVTNRTAATMPVLGFEGLAGNWTHGTATDIIMGGRQSSGTGLDAFHPGYFTPIGAWCETEHIGGLAIGFAMYPINTGFVHTLCYDGTGPGGVPAPRFYIAPVEGAKPIGVRPGQTYTVSFGFRVSTNTDWHHMLGPYRDQFRATFGPVQYTADDRPVVQSILNGGTQDISTNPYGFKDGFHLDLAGNAADYITDFIAPAAASGCCGIILWNPYGTDTRRVEYSPDIMLVPPEVAANLPSIVTAINSAGMRAGRLGQPHWIGVHLYWANSGTPGAGNGLYAYIDTTLTISVDMPLQLTRILEQYAAVAPGSGANDATKGIAGGYTIFYFDSMPTTLNEVLILKALRTQWGPSVLSYTEQFNDLSMLFSGVYTEITGTASDSTSWRIKPYPGIGDTRPDLLIKIGRWLTPGTSVIAHDRTDGPPFILWDNTWLDWLYQRQLSPLPLEYYFAFGNFPALPAAMLAHNSTYLSGSHQWTYAWETSP